MLLLLDPAWRGTRLKTETLKYQAVLYNTQPSGRGSSLDEKQTHACREQNGGCWRGAGGGIGQNGWRGVGGPGFQLGNESVTA